MSTVATTYRYLEPRPESLYRQLFIKGTRIRAEVLYGFHMSAEEPRSAEELAADYSLPLEAVEEAIAYCASKPPEIGEDHASEEALLKATGVLEPDYKYHPYPKPLSAQEMARLFKR